MVLSKRGMIACLAALVMLLGVSGCMAAAAANKPKADTTASVQPTENVNQETAEYLKAARGDLKLIDEIMADKDLSLLEEDTGSDEDVTPEMLAKYEAILTGYTDRIHTALDDIAGRTAPNQPDIAKFQASETEAFKTLDSILQEYNQTLSYTGTFLEVYDSLSSLGSLGETDDLQAIYDALSTAIGDAIQKLQSAEVPSFIESFNKDFIDVLQQMNDAVYYTLSAAATDDPLRSDAGEYLLEILGRRADKIGQECTTDLTDREQKLQEDALAVQKTCDGLKSWLDANIASFGS
jgi:hypothetical protein